MIRALVFILASALATSVLAETVVPTRTIRAASIITDIDVGLVAGEMDNAFDSVGDVIGQEARTTLYAGRPILVDDIGPPALVARNQIVPLKFETGGLLISTDGRALERGGVGDRVRVMNLTSRSTLFGLVQPDGSVQVHH